MYLIWPLKFCISMVFNFSWDGCNTQEKKNQKLWKSFFWGGGEWGKIRCIMGDVQWGISASCVWRGSFSHPKKHTDSIIIPAENTSGFTISSFSFPWSLALRHQSLAFRVRLYWRLPWKNRSAWGGGRGCGGKYLARVDMVWTNLGHDPSIIFITELQPCPKGKNYCGFSKVCLVDPLFPDLCSGKSVVLDSLILGDSPQRYDANYCGTVTVPYPHER